MVVEMTETSFTLQTIVTPFSQTGSHPENGARQFGFERNPDGSVTFYTQGVSQADIPQGSAGAYLQGQSWTAMMKGISNEIEERGGESSPSTIKRDFCSQNEERN